MRKVFAILLLLVLVGPGTARADEQTIGGRCVAANQEVTYDLTLMPVVCCHNGYLRTIGINVQHVRHYWRAWVNEESSASESRALATVRTIDRAVDRHQALPVGISIPLGR